MKIVFVFRGEPSTGQYKRLVAISGGPNLTYPDGFKHEIAMDKAVESNPSGIVILSTADLMNYKENEAALVELGIIDPRPPGKLRPLEAVNAWIAKHNNGHVPPAPVL